MVPMRANVARPHLLVVSGAAARRERWARSLAATGYDVHRCVGPTVSCVALEGRRCQLLAEADIAIYDRASYTPRYARALGVQPSYSALILVAEDGENGRPAALRRVDRDGVACFGSVR